MCYYHLLLLLLLLFLRRWRCLAPFVGHVAPQLWPAGFCLGDRPHPLTCASAKYACCSAFPACLLIATGKPFEGRYMAVLPAHPAEWLPWPRYTFRPHFCFCHYWLAEDFILATLVVLVTFHAPWMLAITVLLAAEALQGAGPLSLI